MDDTFYIVSSVGNWVFGVGSFIGDDIKAYPRVYHPYTAICAQLAGHLGRIKTILTGALEEFDMKTFREHANRKGIQIGERHPTALNVGYPPYEEIFGAVAYSAGPLLSFKIQWIHNVLNHYRQDSDA